MKKTYLLMSMLLLTIALTSCSNDNDESRKVSFDPKYNISYYEEMPGVNEKLGYFYNNGHGNEFIDLEPQSSAPYSLLIVTRNQQGEEALNYLMENNGSVVLDKYLVVTTRYSP